MRWVGIIITLVGVFCLYKGDLVVGGLLFVFGGFVAQGLSPSLRSAGVVLMVMAIAYGFRDAFNLWVIGLVFAGFVLANFNSRRSSNYFEWGFDLDYLDFFDSGSDGGGDGGSDGGGD